VDVVTGSKDFFKRSHTVCGKKGGIFRAKSTRAYRVSEKSQCICAGTLLHSTEVYTSDSQAPGRGPVPGPVINYTGPREVLLEFSF